MNRLVGWMALVALAALCVSLTPAMAQEDLEKQIGEKMQASVDATQSLHAKIAFDVSLNGNPMPMGNLGMEMWFKRGNYARTEMAYPPIVSCQTPERTVVYNGMAGKVLRIPKETLEKLQEKAPDVLKQAGMGADPLAIFGALAKVGGYKVVGEVTVEGQECWQLEVQPDALDAIVQVVGDLMPSMGQMAPKFTAFSMAVQKDTAIVRKIDMDMTLNVGGGEMLIGLGLTMKEIELNEDIPDATFEYEPPADATVIEWTPDRTSEEVMAEFGGGMMGAGGN